jgi:hypothetical protein
MRFADEINRIFGHGFENLDSNLKSSVRSKR